ncbi:hypothetical protein AB6E94_19115 [Vibrio lentus]|uniref:hypothetical protein n=1 Tax=Vibrio splendidus TaxID=29497 RepID=UPI000C817AAC|nr:hypothetical protein [Vibrio splendidus]PMG17812.1 hypothetical protein BCU98_00335 [Vibrio splendidus]
MASVKLIMSKSINTHLLSSDQLEALSDLSGEDGHTETTIDGVVLIVDEHYDLKSIDIEPVTEVLVKNKIPYDLHYEAFGDNRDEYGVIYMRFYGKAGECTEIRGTEKELSINLSELKKAMETSTLTLTELVNGAIEEAEKLSWTHQTKHYNL